MLPISYPFPYPDAAHIVPFSLPRCYPYRTLFPTPHLQQLGAHIDALGLKHCLRPPFMQQKLSITPPAGANGARDPPALGLATLTRCSRCRGSSPDQATPRAADGGGRSGTRPGVHEQQVPRLLTPRERRSGRRSPRQVRGGGDKPHAAVEIEGVGADHVTRPDIPLVLI
eukprot:scaffold2896_cov77-Isochrysis_galbana.AAC.1